LVATALTVFQLVISLLNFCHSFYALCSSVNGSPIDKSDEGALVATVTKKRKGNSTVAAFDINLGEGNYISLNDPQALQHLDSNAKSSAVSQIKVLQDQMATLMEQLTTKES
jgi:hypothetical protein